MTPNTIFVAQDNPAKRKELEQNVIKTFYLSNLSQPTELQDVVNAMRAVLEVQPHSAAASQGAIGGSRNSDQVALAQKLVDDLDKAKPEVQSNGGDASQPRQIAQLGIDPPHECFGALQPNIKHDGDNDHHDHRTSINVAPTGRHQPEHAGQPECDRFPGRRFRRLSATALHERFIHETHPEPADSRA